MDQQKEIDELRLRVRRLEEMVLGLTGHELPSLDLDYEAIQSEIKSMINDRLMLNAIKLYHDQVGCSLTQAKKRVDLLIPPKKKR